MSPDVQANDSLQREREFLLRSIDDLESEHSAGNIDDESYEVLRDDYTARAAAVLRAIDGTGTVESDAPPVSARRRWLTGVAIVGFAALAGTLLASALGARLPGQTVTGNTPQAVSKKSAGAALAKAAREQPNNLAAQLTYARYLDSNHQPTAAQKAYEAAVKLAPNDADALSASAWFLYRVAVSANDDASRQLLLQTAKTRLDHAVEVDPKFPDAHVFRGVVLFRAFNDAEHAVPELQQYLVDQPNGPLSGQVRSVLAEAQRALDASSATVPGANSSTAPATTAAKP